MGRPAKAPIVHFTQGTKVQPLKAELESHVASGRPRFPKDVRQDPELRVIFKSLCGLLEQRRALTDGDSELIRLYCFVFDRHRRNVALLRTEGEITEYERLDSNGVAHTFVKENLRVKIVSGCEKQMAAILSQLGLTPRDRDKAKPVQASSKKEYPPNSVHQLYPHLFVPEKVAPEDMTDGSPDEASD
jgi:P27 family predicted phage terminase small subunit